MSGRGTSAIISININIINKNYCLRENRRRSEKEGPRVFLGRRGVGGVVCAPDAEAAAGSGWRVRDGGAAGTRLEEGGTFGEVL